MASHVAFKCTYNNGGEGPHVGFSGTCSPDVINYNLNVRRRPNCNDSPCRTYWDGGCKGRKPNRPCYESQLLRAWEFGAGWYHTGARAHTPIHMAHVEQGTIAVLTTRFPGDREEDRRVIGLFRIGAVNTGDRATETWVVADPRCRIPLTIEEARAAHFWDFLPGERDWRTGLFRYLNEDDVRRLCCGLRFVVRDEMSRRSLDRLIGKCWPDAANHVPGEALAETTQLVRRVASVRKYGVGGEGENHKRLKKWVAEHPAAIGLRGVMHAELEHVFHCGDTVDILFTHADQSFTVVEIETTDVYPGALQAIKYRALQCAQRREPLDSARVRAVLVGWSIPADVAKLCREYGVSTVEKRV